MRVAVPFSYIQLADTILYDSASAPPSASGAGNETEELQACRFQSSLRLDENGVEELPTCIRVKERNRKPLEKPADERE